MIQRGTYYIQGVGAISPQPTFDAVSFLDEPVRYHEAMLRSVLPDFKQYIHPVQLRRMSRILRIGMSAARICLNDARLDMPDGIITATGYGCADDTIRFLEEILVNKEQHLTPTHFTQSTYNALSGAIALSLKCNNYNTTYVHRAFSFETGVIDAMMQIADDLSKRFLLGGFDETDIHNYTITQRVGYYKALPVHNFELYESDTIGTIQGEGAAFVTLGAQRTDNTYCAINGVKTLIGIRTAEELSYSVLKFLSDNGLAITDIDLLLSGRSGCVRSDVTITQVEQDVFGEIPIAFYKHLTGDYNASSSFATWLIARILKLQKVPDALLPTRISAPKIRKVLYLNQYMGTEYSLMLFSDK
jgi:3-oxoacyl-(acyl-carrier-protein) synthase